MLILSSSGSGILGTFVLFPKQKQRYHKQPGVAMRLKRTTQMSLYAPESVDHPLGEELESISDWLDTVAADLGAQSERGRCGLSCESIPSGPRSEALRYRGRIYVRNRPPCSA